MSAALHARLEALRAAGGPAYDGPGFRFVEGLLQRADDLDGAAADHLYARAESRLQRFKADFEAARAEAAATLRTLQAAGADADGTFAGAFAAADYKAISLGARRALRQAQAKGPAAARERARRLARQARSRGVQLDLFVDDGTLEGASEAEARALGDQLAHALFKDAASHARSALVVARAADNLPDDVGPYNPQALTARALSLMESISPAYLRALLGGLDDLGALKRLAEPKRRGRRRRR